MTKPIAWIIEPIRPPYQPYLTISQEVADKRAKKGDIVTEYVSKRPIQNNNEDDDL